MEELVESLKRASDRMSEILDIEKRAKHTGRDTFFMETHKRIEDGILDSIHTASEEQIDRLVRYRKWVYYYEYEDSSLLENEIKARLRNNKLNEIGI
jgi:hypothetical protein